MVDDEVKERKKIQTASRLSPQQPCQLPLDEFNKLIKYESIILKYKINLQFYINPDVLALNNKNEMQLSLRM